MTALVEAPDYTHCVAGVRTWRVAPNLAARLGDLLWSSSMLDAWPVGQELVAVCHRGGHVPPDEGCKCGVNAWYGVELGYADSAGLEDPRHVTGVVSGSGDIVLFEHGWRAARGRVEAIFHDPALPQIALPVSKKEIAVAYGAAIIAPRDYEAFCLEHKLVLIDPTTL